jgi:hypothetical protein
LAQLARRPTDERGRVISSMQRTAGNLAVTRALTRSLRRVPIGSVAGRPLGTISSTDDRSESNDTTIRAEIELVSDGNRPGHFDGFATRALGYAEAWREHEMLCAVVRDRGDRFHTIKTTFRGRRRVRTYEIVPAPHGFASLEWVNLPRRRQAAREPGEPLRSWAERARSARDLQLLWKRNQVPADFECPHGDHGVSGPLTSAALRLCLEEQFAALAAEAAGIPVEEIHIVGPGRSPNARAVLNFDITLEVSGRGGVGRLPTDRESTLPPSTLTVGPPAFQTESDVRMLAVGVHESAHVDHTELARQWIQRWRATPTRASFADWLREQRDRRRLSGEQYDLIVERTAGGR